MLLNQLLCLLFALSMKSINLETIKVGDILPELITEPITSSTLSEYAKASGDYNPIHLDAQLAKKVGLPNVIAHGMLIMSYLARSITNHIDQVLVKEYGVKFSSMTNLDDILCCKGRVTHVSKVGSKVKFELKLSVKNQFDNEKLVGFAIIKSH